MRRVVPLMLTLGLVACGKGPSLSSSPSPSTSKRPTSTGKLTILEPADGAVVKAGSVKVSVRVTGARIIKKATTTLTPDTGHVHLSLDGTIVTLLAGSSYVVPDVTPGPHIVQAEFAAADHGFFDPRVITTASFEAR